MGGLIHYRYTGGTVLATRVLLHSYDNEQPFTRSLSGAGLPADVGALFVVAHDLVHGYGAP